MQDRIFRRSIFVAALLTVSSAIPALAGEPAWHHGIGREHPHVGAIVGPDGPVDRERLLRHLAAADVVLLGEKHDNVDHHRLQLQVLQALAAAGRRFSVVFEALTTDKQAAMDRKVKLDRAGSMMRTEIERLQSLQKLNPNISSDEIAAVKDESRAIIRAIKSARCRLDSIRFVANGQN